MREIKFRMFDTEEKCFMNLSRIYESRIFALYRNGKERFVFQQYTGLTDKNGMEIYEGDIIKDDTNQLKVIIFEGGTFGCKMKRRKSFYSDEVVDFFYSVFEYVLGDIELEIIGNIYEHPELLEVG